MDFFFSSGHFSISKVIQLSYSADISDLIVITSALEEEGHGLQIGQEIVLEVGQESNSENTQETMTQPEGVWADNLTYKRLVF